MGAVVLYDSGHAYAPDFFSSTLIHLAAQHCFKNRALGFVGTFRAVAIHLGVRDIGNREVHANHLGVHGATRNSKNSIHTHIVTPLGSDLGLTSLSTSPTPAVSFGLLGPALRFPLAAAPGFSLIEPTLGRNQHPQDVTESPLSSLQRS